MVRFMHNLKPETMADVVSFLFGIQIPFTHFENINLPNIGPCVYAIWHAHQCCLYGIPEREKINIMISRSRDGGIIAAACEKLGFKVVHGSKGKKGATEATLQMITQLKEGNYGAIMVDGPNGPAKVCKDGIVKIAKLAGVPIVPIYWYSNNFNFIKVPTWDGFRYPLFSTHLINLYGEPIYVDKNNTPEQDEQIRLQVEKSLTQLEEKAPEEFKKVYRFGRWKRKK